MYRVLQIVLGLLLALTALAQDIGRDEIRGLDEQIQNVKENVLDLTSELARLEEKLLFPSSTQVAFFVSLPSDDNFSLESVEIKLDQQVIAHHLYTFREIEALHKGGVQRIYTANVQAGQHPLEVSYIGKSDSGKEYRARANFDVEKSVGPKFVEIQIAGTQSTIDFKDW